jgi:hypothetical protein
MLTSKVRQFLELLDPQFVQDGQPSCASLETALKAARSRRDDAETASLAVQLALRLLATATVARAVAGRADAPSTLPSADDVLEPAIELLSQSLTAARRAGDAAAAAFAQSRLADAYLQSNQFAKARAEFTDVAQRCVMPRDSWLYFDATQKVGDCAIELEDDAGALIWYQRAMDAAREIDDPFEIHVQHGKIASALGNLKRYNEELQHLHEARDLLARIGADPELQGKIVVHRHSFNLAALPALLGYVDERLAHAKEGLGRELLRELPRQMGERAVAALNGKAATSSAWVVERELLDATCSAADVLARMLDVGTIAVEGESELGATAAVLKRAGSLVRRHFGADLADPIDLAQAARQLVHVDRSRRAALLAREAKNTTLGAGPDFGPGSKHVVYLRSFIASDHLPACNVAPWGRIDLEELLACLLDGSPLIALGNPDFERLGPGRVETTDANWREALRGLALDAQMIIVIPAVTRGTSWELEWVTTNKLLHKTCFIMPAASEPEQQVWWASNWAELKRWAVRLGTNLPAYSAAGSVFRLSSEGLVEEMDYRALYDPDDLHMTLLRGLLFRLNISYDFLYAMQQGLEAQRRSQAMASTAASGSPEEVTPLNARTDDGPDTLAQLEQGERHEMSDWWREAPTVPHGPGLLLMYEGPFRLLWVQDCADLHDALEQIAEGRACDFTRLLFHLRMLPNMPQAQAEQLLDRTLEIGDLVRVRVKLTLSYRYGQVPDADERARSAAQVWDGALKIGVPLMPRLDQSAAA